MSSTRQSLASNITKLDIAHTAKDVNTYIKKPFNLMSFAILLKAASNITLSFMKFFMKSIDFVIPTAILRLLWISSPKGKENLLKREN